MKNITTAAQPGKRKSKKQIRGKSETHEDDDFILTKAQLRELKRRVADVKDPVRYLIQSRFSPTFRLFYNVSDDVYAMNNLAGATLFKRRKTALAVKNLLGGGTRIVRCTTRLRKGQLVPVLPSLRRRKPPRTRVS